MAKIALETEVRSVGGKGSATTNKCCTKARAEVFGCKIKSGYSYKDNQLIEQGSYEKDITRWFVVVYKSKIELGKWGWVLPSTNGGSGQWISDIEGSAPIRWNYLGCFGNNYGYGINKHCYGAVITDPKAGNYTNVNKYDGYTHMYTIEHFTAGDTLYIVYDNTGYWGGTANATPVTVMSSSEHNQFVSGQLYEPNGKYTIITSDEGDFN